jgi:branched-chain amino acid aminotransferase
MSLRTETIWLDGRFVPWEEAKVHVLVHSLHYGTSVFEGIRCYKTSAGPAIFRLEDHLRRLYRSAAYLHMPIPYAPEELADICRQVVDSNGLEDAYVRPIVLYGLGGMNFSFKDNLLHIAVAAWPWGAYLGEDGMVRGIRLKTVSWMKTPARAAPSAAKIAGNYVNSCLGYQEAMRAGFDEALLLNARGNVAEGTGENLFVVRDGILTTPPTSDDLLPGITRDSVMRIARDLGYEVREASLPLGDVLASDEVFLTGTAAEVTPVREIDHSAVGTGQAGPVTMGIQDTFFRAARGDLPAYREWLAYVRAMEASTRAEEVRQMSESVSANAK